MGVAMQIRDVPDDVRTTLAAVATEKGQSVQAYLLELVKREARIVRNRHLFDELAGSRVPLNMDAVVKTVREGREGLDE